MMAHNNKRILFIIGTLDVGGAEQQLAMLAEQLALRNWRVELFAVELKGPLVDVLRSAGVHLHNGGYQFSDNSRARKLLGLVRAQFRLFTILLKNRPAIVHAFLPLTNFMGAVAGRAAFIPLVITSKRALSTHQDRHPKLAWMDRVANALSHNITANSRAVAKDVVKRDGYPAEKIEVIANGLDFSKFDIADSQREQMRKELVLKPNDVAIGFVANLIPYKGHAELIAAFANINKNHPQVKLFLIGEDRGIDDDLQTQIQSLKLKDKISLLGRRSDIPDVLSAMDIGVMASHEEGFSNALLEKLATGLPVVATDVGGNAEALEGMAECHLVKPNDAEDLAQGIERLIVNLAHAKTAKNERRALIRERYSISTMVDAYENLYCDGRSTVTQNHT